jgi:hypothetical protein
MSNGPEFFQTIMGRKFYDADVPRIAKALERIAAALEAQAAARTPRATETIPEQKTGESLCCDDPDCPDKDGEARAQHEREMGGADEDKLVDSMRVRAGACVRRYAAVEANAPVRLARYANGEIHGAHVQAWVYVPIEEVS